MSEAPAPRDWNAISDDEFRAIAAAFFAGHVPAHLRFLSRRPRWAEVKPWYLTMSQQGWCRPGRSSTAAWA